MTLKLCSTDINKLYLGDTEINQAYLGSNLVYNANPIASNGFVTDGLVAFWHAGNILGDGNYVTNSPFPSEWVDLTGNGHNLTLSNFAGTTASGANGNNTEGNPSYIQLDGVDDAIFTPASINNTNFPQDEMTICISIKSNFDGTIKKPIIEIYKHGKNYWLTDYNASYITGGFNDSYSLVRDIVNAASIANTSALLTSVGKTGVDNYYKLYYNNNSTPIIDVTTPDTDWRPENQSINITDDCYINYIAVYNKVLSSDEITQNYNAGLIWS